MMKAPTANRVQLVPKGSLWGTRFSEPKDTRSILAFLTWKLCQTFYVAHKA